MPQQPAISSGPIPRAVMRASIGAVVGCAAAGFVALTGDGLARETTMGRDLNPLKMGALGGAVILAIPGAMAVVRMYSNRERWSSAGLTVALLPGAAIGAIGGVMALVLGAIVTWGLARAGIHAPDHPWVDIVIGGALLGAVLALTGLPRIRWSGPRRPTRRRPGGDKSAARKGRPSSLGP